MSDSCSVSIKEARMGRTSTDSRSWDGEGVSCRVQTCFC